VEIERGGDVMRRPERWPELVVVVYFVLVALAFGWAMALGIAERRGWQW